MDVTPEIAQFLVSPRGRAALDRARAVRDVEPLARNAAVSGGFSPEEVRAALFQDDLRVKARTKTRHAEALLFTTPALEQATTEVVADERAERFAAFRVVADLGAGIGLDTIALARAGRRVVAVERDPVRAAFLAHNVAAAGAADRVEVVAGDFLASPPAADAAFLDPDRRPGGRRFRDPEMFEPPPAVWAGLAERYRHLLVKLAPGTKPDTYPEENVEWVSLRGEMKEARLGFGDLAIDARRRALLLPSRATLSGTGRAWPDPWPPSVGDVLLDPDPAIVVSDLVGDAALAENARPVHPRIAYLVGDHAVAWADSFAVKEVLGAAPKEIQAFLDREHVGDLTIRSRGVSDSPDEWRRKLRVEGTKPATIVLTRGPDDRYLVCSVQSLSLGFSGFLSPSG